MRGNEHFIFENTVIVLIDLLVLLYEAALNPILSTHYESDILIVLYTRYSLLEFKDG